MELPQVGEHCQVCNRNDYLPFKCAYCNKLVCINHKTNHSDCPINQITFNDSAESNSLGTSSEVLKDACHYCRLSFLKLELVNCSYCSGNYCLTHRHQHQHNCISITKTKDENELRSLELSEKSRNAIEKLKPHLKSGFQKPRQSSYAPQNNSALAKKVRLMKLKLSSRGVVGTPEKDRIYFLCKFCHNPSAQKSQENNDGRCINFFASPEQYVGRLVDWTANELNISSTINFQPQKTERLVFQKVLNDGSRQTLNSNAFFKEYLANGTLESGDEMLLTFVKE